MNQPAERRADQLILEGIVTTKNEDASIHVSPMGPVVDRAVTSIRLRPFQTSRTYQNLKRTRIGVFHITDDVDLLARSAIGSLEVPPEMRAELFNGLVIASTCRWYAFEVESLEEAAERAEIACHVVDYGRLRDFLGWNRAMHAVLEAAILATRVNFLPADEIQAQLRLLAQIVEKTASEIERSAFSFLEEYIERAASEE